jgi:lipooligosaccharide transport system permease protein
MTGHVAAGQVMAPARSVPSPFTRASSSFLLRWWSYKKVWRTGIFTSFVQPMLTLLALGLGVGGLVTNGNAIGGLSYARFIGPGLLVSSCALTGAVEGMWMVLDGLNWNRCYHAQAATPLSARDMVHGHVLWIVARLSLGSVMVAVALAVIPSTRSTGIVAAVPVGVLTGLAFGMPMTAYSVTLERDLPFANLQRFFLNPLYLFAGAFFPFHQLPVGVRGIAGLFPLWHGIEVARGAMTTLPSAWPVAAHLAVIGAWIVGGTFVAYRTFAKRLAS